MIGRLVFFKQGEREVRRIYVEDAEKELVRFQKARVRTAEELQELCEESAGELGETNAMIFEVQQMVIEDEAFLNQVVRIITEQKLNAEYAVRESAREFLKTCGGETGELRAWARGGRPRCGGPHPAHPLQGRKGPHDHG